MKQLILIITSVLMFSSSIYAQNSIDSVLIQIEKNNTTLMAFRKNVDADQIGNKTGLNPINPDVRFNYLWGNPSIIGNRTDFNFNQTIDFPTAYSYKNQLSDLKNRQEELEYEKQRNSILLQSQLVCIELIYQNALLQEYSIRLNNAKKIANAWRTKFDLGETGILDYNKSQIILLNSSKDYEKIEIERNSSLSELTRLNGGIPIKFSVPVFIQQSITPDFEQWYSQAEKGNLVLQWIKNEIVVSQKQKQLNTALSLPKISAGYMSEKMIGEHFQGITLGVSIPLWENKNTVAYAEAKTIALQSMESDAKLQFYNEMKAMHKKVIDLQSSVSDYRNQISNFSNTVLLQKALDKGEISLSEFYLELSVYYESTDQLLEMEHALNKAIIELNKYL